MDMVVRIALVIVFFGATGYGDELPNSKIDNIAYNKPVGSTGFEENHPPTLAVDGIRNPDDTGNSCFYSTKINTIVFYVDLQAEYEIKHVLFLNRRDCCYYRAKDLDILVTKTFDINEIWASNYTVCGRTDTLPTLEVGELHDYECIQRAVGRYVVVMKRPGTFEKLQICELEVYTSDALMNIALRKPTRAGSEYQGFYLSTRATDGYHMDAWSAQSCYGSNQVFGIDMEWWSVDLGREYVIRKMSYLVRSDASPERAVGIKISVATEFDESNFENNDFFICAEQYRQLVAGSRNTFLCKHRTIGKFVVISKDRIRDRSFLEFCELEVFGNVKQEERGYNKPTRMSGETTDFKQSARGNDGNSNPDSLDNSCVSTPGATDSEYWSIDLLATYMIEYVMFVARLDTTVDALRDFIVYTAKTLDHTNMDTTEFDVCTNVTTAIYKGHVKPLYCTLKSVGRYVIIMKDASAGEPLEFCEMEIYGDPYDGNIAFRQTVQQRSRYWIKQADLANDGHADTCSRTLVSETGAGVQYWHVTLAKRVIIDKVVVVNAQECNNKCLRDFKIYVADAFDKTNVDETQYYLCAHHINRLQSGQKKLIRCETPLRGSHLIIIVDGSYPMILCEVEIFEAMVWENLALYKPTYQSSDYNSAYGFARLAVDGWRLSNFGEGSCTMTHGSDPEEWWSVDLEQSYLIRKLIVVNRKDCCSEHLAKFTVLVGETFIQYKFEQSQLSTCYQQTNAPGPGDVVDIRCSQPTAGRWVVIKKDNIEERSPLTLCEVEVYGSENAENLAVRKPAMLDHQAGFSTTDLTASRANDGNTNADAAGGSCLTTQGKNYKEWVAIDLLDLYLVQTIVVYNRQDCCGYMLRTFRIFVQRYFFATAMSDAGFSVCHVQEESIVDGDIRQIVCSEGPKIGRYVALIKTNALNEPVQMCEFEVYGRVMNEANLALNRPASMRTSAAAGINLSDKANDGNHSPICAGFQCAQSAGTANNDWWTVVLDNTYTVEKVAVGHGIGCCPTNFTQIEVYVSYNPNNDKLRTAESVGFAVLPADLLFCAAYNGAVESGQIIDIYCEPKTSGTYVSVVKRDSQGEAMKYFEIEVYGRLNVSEPETTPAPPPSTTPIPTIAEKPYDPIPPAVGGTFAFLVATTGTTLAILYVLNKKGIIHLKNFPGAGGGGGSDNTVRPFGSGSDMPIVD